MDIPPFTAKPNAKGFNFLRIEQVISTKPDPISLNLVYRFADRVKTKVILQAGSNSAIYVESNRAKQASPHGYHELEHGNGTMLEFEPAPGDGSYIGISSQTNWGGISGLYRAKAGAARRGAVGRSENLDDALSRFAKLGLTYVNDDENSGFVPRINYNSVVEKGQGDCKDMTVVMMRVLAENAIESQPVLMGVHNGMALPPMLRSLPDFTWPNHVILYLPIQQKFIDPTLARGHYVIDSNYSWYGAIGVNLDTAKRVIIGQ